MKKIFLLLFVSFLLLFVSSQTTHAQSIPKNPNKTENGKRQGKWTMLLNEKKNKVDSLKNATFYRILTYKDDKPTGITEDYYLDGKLQMRANLVADRPFLKYEGTATFYRKNGKRDSERKYENGKQVSEVFLNLNGSIVKEDWDKLCRRAIDTLLLQNKFAEALATVERARKQVIKQFGKKHENYGTCLLNFGTIYNRQGKYDKATPKFQQAIQTYANTVGKADADYSFALTSFGSMYFNQGQYLKAEPLFQEALRRLKVDNSTNPANYALPLNNLAALYLRLAKYSQADTLFTEAGEIFRKAFGDKSAAYAVALNNLASVYYYQARYAKADSLFRQALAIRRKEYGDTSPVYAESLTNLGSLYIAWGKYAQADSVLGIAKKTLEKGEKNLPKYAAFLQSLANLYTVQAKYAQADSLFLQALDIQKDLTGKANMSYAIMLNNLAYAYTARGKYAQAENMLLEAQQIFEKNVGNNHPEYNNILNSLGELYRAQGKYKQAEPFYLKAKEITLQTLGEQHPDHASALSNLAILYASQGLYAKEAPLRLAAMEIFKKTLGEKHTIYASQLSGLATLYEEQGNYAKTDSLCQLAVAIEKEALGELHPAYAMNLGNLGTHYYNQSNYAKAEPLFLKAIEIFRKNLGESHPYTIQTLRNLASVYTSQGETEKAEKIFLATLKSIENSFGKKSESYAASLKSLADLYYNQSDYAKAAPMLQAALEIFKNVLGEKHIYYAGTLGQLANVYLYQKNYAKAESLFEQATQLFKEIYGDKHPDYAASLGNWAELYRLQKRYNKSIPLYEQALAIIGRAKGENYPGYATYLNSLALVYDNQYNFEKASPLFLKVAETKLVEIQNNLSNLSESGKQKYLANNQYLPNLHSYITHVLEKQPDSKDLPRLLETAFTLQLQTKGLLLSETQKVRNRILASKDTALVRKFETWQGLKNFIAKAYNMPAAERKSKKINLTKLESEANDLEKTLATRSADFQAAFNSPAYTYQDVQKKLGENEVAVEIIKGFRINWEKPEQDTTFYYLALILTKKDLIPVLINNGRELEGDLFGSYRRNISFQRADEESYGAFWAEIAKAVGTTPLRIYFSPDGIYHSINLNTLQNPETKKYLLEEFDIRIVTNLKEILEEKTPSTQKTASLFGRPAYSMSKEDYEKSTTGLRGKIDVAASTATQIAWKDLEGTQIEVVGIDSVLRKNNWKTEVFLDKEAVEERVKKVKNPTILHIATHGYFAPTDSKIKVNNMLSSGIVLAGVNTTDKGENSEDGILTALEATNLNLDQTDLVVLSACETGLGELATGEGVYGLQRGFKVAGAKAVMMSLWSVNDAATQELMNTFYDLWFSGISKRAAFKQAQILMKAKYKKPYFWGAFVMVGD